MKKFIVSMLVCLALIAVMPAFAATAGPEATGFAIDATPIASAVELCPTVVVSEKEVSAPPGRSTKEALANNDFTYYVELITVSLEDSSPPAAILSETALAPPGYFLLL